MIGRTTDKIQCDPVRFSLLSWSTLVEEDCKIISGVSCETCGRDVADVDGLEMFQQCFPKAGDRVVLGEWRASWRGASTHAANRA